MHRKCSEPNLSKLSLIFIFTGNLVSILQKTSNGGLYTGNTNFIKETP